MKVNNKRQFVVTSSNVQGGDGRSSSALLRDAIRLEVAMRLTINGTKVAKAWDIADDFVSEMDKRIEEPPQMPALTNNNRS
jgi:hypothetical protein